jgi:hypothetical protein
MVLFDQRGEGIGIAPFQGNRSSGLAAVPFVDEWERATTSGSFGEASYTEASRSFASPALSRAVGNSFAAPFDSVSLSGAAYLASGTRGNCASRTA